MRPDGASSPGRNGAETAPDRELVERVLAGEGECYATLVRRYQEGLYRHALGMVLDGDAAADLVQDAFVKAYANLERCRDRSKFGTWVFQILRNRCLDYLKERRRRDLSLDGHHNLAVAEGGPDADLERRALRDAIERALAKLPEAQREAFLLKHVRDLSYEEMAEIAGTTASALRMRVLRARETLQALLEAERDAFAGGM